MNPNNPLSSRRGVTLIGVAFLAVIITLLAFIFVAQSVSIREKEALIQEQVTAQIQASELLETLRAFESGTQLINYLKTTTHLACSPINILDRAHNRIVNADPLAVLGLENLKTENRYFEVQVYNAGATPPAVDQSWCDTPFSHLVGGVFARNSDNAKFTANPNWRLLITVGVSWVTKAQKSKVQEVALSTLLPSQ